MLIQKQANLRDLIAATDLVVLLKFDPNHRFFSPDDLKICWMTSKKKGISTILHQPLWIISNPSVNSNCSYSPETLNSGQNQRFYVPCDLEIWWMTLENNRTFLLYYIKFCVSLRGHLWIQTVVIAQKSAIFCPVWSWKLMDDLKKTIGHLLHTTSSFVHHFKVIGESKLESQSRQAHSG